MGAKVKGINQARDNLAKLVGHEISNKVMRALHRAMDIGGAQSAIYTPIDTKKLINSQFREITDNGTLITGRVGYSTNYAAYVHDPAVKQKFKRPTAKKEFLRLGFDENKTLIDKVVMEELKL